MNDLFLRILFLVFCIHKCFLAILVELRAKKRELPPVPLTKAYLRGIIFSTWTTAFALLVAVTSKTSVFGLNLIDGKSLSLGVAFLVLTFVLSVLDWKFASDKYKKRAANFLPRTTPERMIWVAVSIVSGVGEEIIFRAVLFEIVLRWTGHYWISGSISAVIFALGHARQGLFVVVNTSFVALGLQYLVKISSGLYLAIGVHFSHNLIEGILGGILIKPVRKGEPARDQAFTTNRELIHWHTLFKLF